MKTVTSAKIFVGHDRLRVTYQYADLVVKFGINRSSNSVNIAAKGSYKIYKTTIDAIADFFVNYKLKDDDETYGGFLNRFCEVANSSANPEIFLAKLKSEFKF